MNNGYSRYRHSDLTVLAVLVGYMVVVFIGGAYLAAQAYNDYSFILRMVATLVVATLPLPMIERYMRRPKYRSSY